MLETRRIIIAGLVGEFIGNGIMRAIFSSPPVKAILYHPALQSPLFIGVTPHRNVVASVTGLVILSVVHA